MHATWNFLLKRAGGSNVAIVLSKIVEAVIFAPVFFIWYADSLPAPAVVLLLTGFAATGVLASYAALGGAYRHGDLSFVYPIARGAALVVLPILGALAFGERLTAPSLLALALIVAGILTLQLRDMTLRAVRDLGSALRSPATRYALLAAVITAVYTIWDKRAIRQMEPFAYMYLYTLLVAVAWSAWTWKRVEATERRAVWRAHPGAIVAIGLLNTGSYLLTLIALQRDVSSLVIGLRQVSIVFGVALGASLLGERLSPPRAVGVTLIAVGCVGIALA